MASLSAFLHPEQTGNKEVIVSERFKENGKPVPFVIRPITQKENEELLKKHRKVDKQGVETFNRINYNRELTALAVVEPDLNSAELQNGFGVLGAAGVLSAMLYVGEYSALMEAVQELSGLDSDINKDIDEAKN
ncbi:MAG TPA: phage portal protein [Candidatus Hungatella pullicola]|nr:phage portal protein [Candidatus Hungatella pullicola]